ncbi:MAG: site-specific integrase [Pyrinomonadaceae bacterium]
MPYKRNGKWYTDIRLRVGGHPTGERLRRLIPKVTKRWEAVEAEKKIAAQELYGDPSEEAPPTVAEFCEAVYFPHIRQTMSMPANIEYSVRASILPFFAGRRIDSISAFDVERFKVARMGREKKDGTGMAAGTINLEIAQLSAICRLALLRGHLKTNPCAGITRLELPPQRVRFLSADEEQDLMRELEMATPYMMPIVRVALETGMRLNELLNLKVESVDLAAARLYVEKTKWKRDPRRSLGIPLSGATLEILRRLVSDGRTGCAFRSDVGRRPARRTVQQAFARAVKRAGVKNFHFHDLRHTFGSRLGQGGASPYIIARLMGHADLKMSLVYVHLTERDERAAVEMAQDGFLQKGHRAAPGGEKGVQTAARKRLKGVG